MPTTLTRWTPVIDPFRDRFDRLFNQFLGQALPGTASSEEVSNQRWAPSVDIKETADALTLTAELPGLTKADVQITIENQVLTISGERKFQEKETKGETYHRIERAYGSFLRSFTLPANVKADKVDASFANGLLTVTLPQADEAKPRKVEIK
jgi:HSP20 family protein